MPYQGTMMPYAPISLFNKTRVDKHALVDSGSTINVLPYQLGIDLGFVWNKAKAIIPLGGNIQALAIPVLIPAIVGTLDPVDMSFAWAGNDIPPLILGQTNFFSLYDVCFFKDKGYFEVTAK